MSSAELPFPSLNQRLLADLASGRCASVIGLSNTGKSTLLRSLAAWSGASFPGSRQVSLPTRIYVDCNQAVALSPQAFYEVVLRSMLERLGAVAPPDLIASLRNHHQTITETESAFAASLSFSLAVIEACTRIGRPLCLLLDAFDDIYTSLDERALLNLRALRDRFEEQLIFVTATDRALPDLRGGEVEGEFAELFSGTTYGMPAVEPGESDRYLKEDFPGLSVTDRELCYRLSGGHPGLLTAIAQSLSNLAPADRADQGRAVALEPGPRAECLKLWIQLTPEEQADVVALALESAEGALPARVGRLEDLGLAHQGQLISPLLADFAARRARPAEVAEEGIHLDPDSGDVWVDGIRIPVLTDLEFRLLRLLHSRHDKLTDKYSIVTAVWGEQYLGEVDDARVEKLVSRLRSQIEPDPANPRYLITVRGRGYKLSTRPQVG